MECPAGRKIIGQKPSRLHGRCGRRSTAGGYAVAAPTVPARLRCRLRVACAPCGLRREEDQRGHVMTIDKRGVGGLVVGHGAPETFGICRGVLPRDQSGNYRRDLFNGKGAARL